MGSGSKRLSVILAVVLCFPTLLWAAPNSKIFETGIEYNTIQEALNAATAGQHIYVYPGTHTGAGNIGLTWPNVQDITLMASPELGGTSANVILDGQNITRHIRQSYAVRWQLDNLTLINGSGNGGEGGAIYVSNSSSSHLLTVDNCVISGNVASYGGALSLTNLARMVMTRSIVRGNSAIQSGGALSRGDTTLTDCLVEDNDAGWQGGGFTLGKHTLTGCVVSGNSAVKFGGGFASATVTTNGSVIKNNSAERGGALMYCTTTLTSTTINGNQVTDIGGAFYGGTNTLTDCIVNGNSADYAGGAFHSGTNLLSGCMINGNTANSGGAFDSSTVTLNNSTIAGNRSVAYSGGAFSNGTYTLNGCTVTGNQATQYGGGFYYGTNNLTGCVVAENTADICGGGFYFGTNVLKNCTVAENSAQHGGGFYNSISTLTGCAVIGNSATLYGGGFRHGDTRLLNCTVADNTPQTYYDNSSSGGQYGGELEAYNTIFIGAFNGGTYSSFSTCILDHCAFTDTSLPTAYWNASNLVNGFTTDSFEDYAGGDYRLRSTGLGINYGSNNAWSAASGNITTDLAGNARTVDGHIDLGAYEYQTDIAPALYIAPITSPTEIRTFSISGQRSYDTGSLTVQCGTAGSIGAVSYPDERTWQVTVNNLSAGNNSIQITGHDGTGHDSVVQALSVTVNTPISIQETGQMYDTIQDALDNAAAGQHIYLKPGTYSGTGNVGLIWPNRHDIVLMANPAEGGSSTNVILDAQTVTRHIQQKNSVRWELGNLTLINGQVSTINAGDRQGGSIYNYGFSGNRLTMSNCVVSGNAARDGGAIYGISFSQNILSNVVFRGNSATQGGAIYSGSNEMTDCTFTGNSAQYGAAIHGGTNNMIRCAVTGNSAYDGGGFCYGNNTLTDCTIAGNSASHEGGAFYYSTCTLTDCTIANNSASNFGGGFHYSTNILNGCTIVNNSANNGGGFGLGTSTLTNCVVTGNSAVNYGGAFFDGTNILTGTVIENNNAANGGAFRSGRNTLISCTVGKNSATTNGGAFYAGDNKLINCTVVDNTPHTYYDLWAAGGSSAELEACNTIFAGSFNGGTDSYFTTVTLNHCTLTDTSLPTAYWNASNLISGFTTDFFVDYAGGDYRLKNGAVGINYGSNALWNAASGNAVTDIAGNSRTVDDYIDLGAYEYQADIAPAFYMVPVTSPTKNHTFSISGQRSYDTGSLTVQCGTAGSIGVIAYPDGRSWQVTINNLSEGLNTIQVTGHDNTGHDSGVQSLAVTVNTSIFIKETGEIYFTIQEALDAAAAGQHVYLKPGTYTGPGNVGLVWPNVQDISLMASPEFGGSSTNVILDAQTVTRHVLQKNTVRWQLDNLTLINGRVSTIDSGDKEGGSIYIQPNLSSSSLTMNACVVSGNAAYRGGGIKAYLFPKLFLTGVTIRGNSATYGGGIDGGTDTLAGCTIERNNSSWYGGGLNNGVFSLTDCILSDNSAIYGGAFGIAYNYKVLTGCIVSGNSATYGGAVVNGRTAATDCTFTGNNASKGGAFYGEISTLTGCIIDRNSASEGGGFYLGDTVLINCTVAGNTPQVYYDITSSQGELEAYNTIFAGDFNGGGDSYFTTVTLSYCALTDTSLPTDYWNADNLINGFATDSFADYAGGDYRLTDGSVAVNSGSNALWMSGSSNITVDRDGNPRIYAAIIDLGVYELQQDTTPPAAPGIDAVSSSITLSIQTLSGTKSIDTNTINVLCSTAIVSDVAYPDDTHWSVTLSALSEGENHITVNAADALGNTSDGSTVSVFVDTLAPVAPVIGPVNATSSTTIRLSGSKSADTTTVNIFCDTAVVGDIWYIGATSWAVTLSSLSEGENTVSVNAVDDLGNMSTWVTASILVDVTPPLTPTINPLTPTEATTLLIGGTRSEDTAVITVICEQADAVQPVSYPSASVWQVVIEGLPLGETVVSVNAVDAVGNTSAWVTTSLTVIDLTAPVVPSVNPVDSPTDNPNQLISGTRSIDTVTVSVYCQSATTVNQVSYPSAMTWQVLLQGLMYGENIVTVNGVDQSGNLSAAATVSIRIQPPVIVSRSAGIEAVFVADPVQEQGFSTENMVLKRVIVGTPVARIQLSSEDHGLDFSEDFSDIVITRNEIGLPEVHVPATTGSVGEKINQQAQAPVPLDMTLLQNRHPIVIVDAGEGYRSITHWSGEERSGLSAEYQGRIASFNYQAELRRLYLQITRFSSYGVAVVNTVNMTALAPVALEAGQTVTFSILVTDTNGETVEGAPVLISIVSGSGTVAPTPVQTDSSGNTTFTYTAPQQSETTAVIKAVCDGVESAAVTVSVRLLDPYVVHDLQVTSNILLFSGKRGADTARIEVLCEAGVAGSVSYPAADSWQVTLSSLADGEHTLTVNAYDAGDVLLGSSVTTVLVDTVPPAIVSLRSGGTEVSDGETIENTQPLTITATDNYQLAAVSIYLDGTLVASKSSTLQADTLSYTPQTPLTLGNHQIIARATDKIGQMRETTYTVTAVGKLEISGRILAYPNPFRSSAGTMFVYTLSKPADIRLVIYDMWQTRVAELEYTEGLQGGQLGENRVTWDGRDFWGSEVGSGLYLVQLFSGRTYLGRCKLVVVND